MRALAATVLVGLALVAAGCGGDDEKKPVTGVTGTARATTPSTAPAARAFRAHVEAAVAALRTGIEEPLRNGDFSGDPLEIVAAFSKAGSSVTTAVGELGKAVDAAQAEGGLSELAAQAESLLTRLPGLLTSFKDGQIDQEELAAFLDDLDALGDTAGAGGLDVPTRTTTPAQ